MKIIKLPHDCWMHEYSSGDKYYFRNKGFHREDGPAVDRSDDSKEWWLNGICVPCTTQVQFERLLKLKAFW
jgi:hypothetical protein